MKIPSTHRKWPLYAIAIAVIALVALSFQQLANLFSPTIPYPAKSWQTSTPEEQGLDSAKLAEALVSIKKAGIPIHSLTIVRHGSLIVDAVFYPYDGASYHDVASVTKSVMTTLIGIAADRDQIDLDRPVLSYFPDRTIANLDARKESITVRHLLYNASGLDCTRDGNERTLQQMRASDDYVQFVLDLKSVYEPGTRFSYCSPTMHLLSAILQEATGMTAHEYAQAYLFEPLGIQHTDWVSDPQGYTRGWGDLALYPQDMARIGYLFLHEGRWGNQQIVSREWVRQATVKQIDTHEAENYGYGWWLPLDGEEPVFFAAEGASGHRIIVVPEWDLVLVTTDGGFDYDQIVPYLLNAIVDLEKPLPANPAGIASLKAALAEVAQSPAAEVVPSLPPTAAEISGRVYTFEPNDLGLESMRLDFTPSSQTEPPTAVLAMNTPAEGGLREFVVGLDGLYRWNQTGRPTLTRGVWADDGSFVIEFNEGPGHNLYVFRTRFEGNQMELDLISRKSGIDITVQGQAAE